mgnify:CR=1 FL=1|jgi:hypothetical protein
MPVSWKQESERLVVCRISGVLSYEEWDLLNTGDDPDDPRAIPEQEDQKLRVLIVLDNFEGWDKSESWEDLDWVEANDRRLQRMAFVGEERWRDSVEVFALKGLRPVEIEYFGPGQESEARRWLDRA